MTKTICGVLALIFSILSIFGSSVGEIRAATGSIDKVVFTSDQIRVAPGEVSGAITIQLQNSSGEAEKLDQTADVEFESTSSTGEFLGGTGKEITKTMSTGSANKTFYYRDSNEGEHTITVTVRPRGGNESFEAKQRVIVGEGGDVTTSASDDEEDEESLTTTSDNAASEDSSLSDTHSSPAKLSNFSKTAGLKVGAGRERTVMIHTPIVFSAESNQGSARVQPRMDYVWSFGDGAGAAGRTVTHHYAFPGEYQVVLNGEYRGEYSVARTKVVVVEPKITILTVKPGQDGYIEIKNELKNEINLNDWKIKVKDKEYIIPRDTIIAPMASIKFPNTVTFLSSDDEASLLFPNEKLAFEYKPILDAATSSSTLSPSLPIIPTPIFIPREIVVSPVIKKETELIATTTTGFATVTLPRQSAAVSEAGIFSRTIRFLKALFTIHD